jgi:uncharacterized delta-60 repeat protein
MSRRGTTPFAGRRTPLLVAATVGALVLALAAHVAARPGDLDPSFSRNGIVKVQGREQIRKLADPEAIAILEDGRILIVGTRVTTALPFRPAIARYRSNGKLDRSFDGDGYAAVPPDGGFGTDAIALSDGRVLICGYKRGAVDPGPSDLIFARVLPNGEPDPSFADGGQLVVSSQRVNRRSPRPRMEVAPGGDIVVAFRATRNGFGVLRLTRNGEIVTGFGHNGIRTVSFPRANEDPRDLTINRRGGIALTGSLGRHTGRGFQYDFGVVRLKPGGKLDRRFAGDGRKIFDLGRDYSAAIEFRRNGHLLVAGLTGLGLTGRPRLALFELKQNGSLDRAFGTNGVRKTRLHAQYADVGGLALQRPGRAIVFGSVVRRSGNSDFVVLRHTKGGKLDRTFSGNGRTVVDVGRYDNFPRDLALQRNGRIVALGTGEDSRSGPIYRAVLRFKNE